MLCLNRRLTHPKALNLIPTAFAIEALPEFDEVSRRFLAHWIDDRLLVRQTLAQQFLLENPPEALVDKVHEHWLQTL